jgi:uridylate kinase
VFAEIALQHISASIFGKLLQASAVNIWTDVDGVMSADPRRVPEAKVYMQCIYMHAYRHTYVYVQTYICIRTCIHMYTYTYT